jgi:hypothetical protein
MRFFTLFSLGLIAFPFIAPAQTATGFARVDSVQVYFNSQPLLFPWAGGLNFCQLSEIDLDMDGRQDLFIFDRSGNKITTYLNNGTANQVDYVLAPEYVHRFPAMHDWALLRDYNCDGKADIFTYSSAGFSIYKNTSTIAMGLQFQLVKFLVNTNRSPNSSNFMGNLFVSQVDIPAIRDMDGDGDLDILTFQNVGNQVEYHQNMSMELYGVCDSIRYEVGTNCWGEFEENATNAGITLGISCPAVPIRPAPGMEAARTRHAGSCLECINTDGDIDQDVLIGDVSSSFMTFLRNGGTSTYGQIDSVDAVYPSYNTILNLDIFPCPFHLDVNNDGQKDVIFSPAALNTAENFKSMYYYRNTSANNDVAVDFVQDDFLQEDMIDVGQGCFPVFFDYDGDGDQDLLVGNYGYYQSAGPYQSKIALLKNTGSAAYPAFTFITDDFANIHANYPSITAMAITFGDLDNDGDKDMLLGDINGELHFFEKLAGPADNFTLAQSAYQGIDIGGHATPQLIDVDRDGLLDLLIGKQAGTLSYFRNTGTAASPTFTLVTNFFGGVYVNQYGYTTGYSAPHMYDDSGDYVLLVGSERGWLNRYDDIDGNLTGTFTRTDSMYVSYVEGGNVTVSVTDLNSDGLKDVVIGNYAGGLSLFYGDNNVSTGHVFAPEFSSFTLYPNPATDNLIVQTEKEFTGTQTFVIHDLSGRLVHTQQLTSRRTVISTMHLAPGVYSCTMTDKNGVSVNSKLVIGR